MEKKNFNEIIDFAIAREQEAVKFYHDLQGIVRLRQGRKCFVSWKIWKKGT